MKTISTRSKNYQNIAETILATISTYSNKTNTQGTQIKYSEDLITRIR